jgi:hypothetical protein
MTSSGELWITPHPDAWRMPAREEKHKGRNHGPGSECGIWDIRMGSDRFDRGSCSDPCPHIVLEQGAIPPAPLASTSPGRRHPRVDMVVDDIDANVLAPCLRALAVGGRFVTIGRMSRSQKGELDVDLLAGRRLHLYGVNNRLRTPAQRAESATRFIGDPLPALSEGPAAAGHRPCFPARRDRRRRGLARGRQACRQGRAAHLTASPRDGRRNSLRGARFGANPSSRKASWAGRTQEWRVISCKARSSP